MMSIIFYENTLTIDFHSLLRLFVNFYKKEAVVHRVNYRIRSLPRNYRVLNIVQWLNEQENRLVQVMGFDIY
jgi:hypothetical protein